MHQVLFGTVLLVSFLGGVVALLAPCCVSVMLPAYLATGFARRTGIAAATGAFAAGVATLIVPIGLGASAVSAANIPVAAAIPDLRENPVAKYAGSITDTQHGASSATTPPRNDVSSAVPNKT